MVSIRSLAVGLELWWPAGGCCCLLTKVEGRLLLLYLPVLPHAATSCY